MTDQTKAPERICVEFNNNGTASVISPVPKILGTMEYIRKDIADAHDASPIVMDRKI